MCPLFGGFAVLVTLGGTQKASCTQTVCMNRRLFWWLEQ